ncbi:nucleoside hydrolase [Philodulcilactobacillus myokoensis]|uniref:Nucleoside hydrolase n=1 Tax=Philodulcilactobacillus myokoensis TaxID=2929573 RepID=A0A9W6B1D2_9LACO|nr:nucleoside hydrolase [Philodulcilactobacillus myokoensis]GLB47095.1 nucleoside hydrolase [Philodulcilactobacillus myokoensis]
MHNVYYSHDGNVDDLTSLLLLMKMNDVNVLGVGAMGADSYVTPAVDASRRIVDLFSKNKDLSVAKSNSRPMHEFPKEWRLGSFSFDDMPMLHENGGEPKAKLASKPAHLDIVDKLNHADGKVTMVMTGPMSDLARALKVDPSIENKIDRIYWMGGSMNNEGNVMEPEADGTQEWNSYWDSEAVKTVFDTKIKITIVSLDSTKQVPLTDEVRQHWAKGRKYPALELLGSGFALMHSFGATYYLWDDLTMVLSAFPEIANYKHIKADVKTTGKEQGRTFITDRGRDLTMVTSVDAKAFYDRIDTLCKRK